MKVKEIREGLARVVNGWFRMARLPDSLCLLCGGLRTNSAAWGLIQTAYSGVHALKLWQKFVCQGFIMGRLQKPIWLLCYGVTAALLRIITACSLPRLCSCTFAIHLSSLETVLIAAAMFANCPHFCCSMVHFNSWLFSMRGTIHFSAETPSCRRGTLASWHRAVKKTHFPPFGMRDTRLFPGTCLNFWSLTT